MKNTLCILEANGEVEKIMWDPVLQYQACVCKPLNKLLQHNSFIHISFHIFVIVHKSLEIQSHSCMI